MVPLSARSSPTMQRASVDLPEPDFADERQGAAFEHLQADAGNGTHFLAAHGKRAAAPGEGLFQPGDREEVALSRLGLAHGVARNEARHSGDQSAGVVVLRAGKNFVRASVLDQHSLPHDGNAIGNFRHHAEIVGDEHDGSAVPGLQLLEQLQDLRLSRDIERGGWFVGDDQRRLQRQRHGDHHPLALATGQFVRVAREDALGFRQAHVAEHLDDALAAFAGAQLGVDLDDLVCLAPDRHQRIECDHGFLEDHGDAAATHGADALGRQRKQVLAVVEDAAARDAHVRFGQQAQDGFCHDRLAGAGFADHAQDLAAHHLERYAVDGFGPVGPGRQPDGQIFDR